MGEPDATRADVERLLHEMSLAHTSRIHREAELVARRDELQAALAMAHHRVSELRMIVQRLLMSADASWEHNRGGHDWPEACEAARAALAVGGEKI